MISIKAVSYRQAATAPIAARFGAAGGAIGRGRENALVLPDPEQAISRVHAQVVARGPGYAIVDRGSHPVRVNGRVVGNGQEAPIRPGDRLQIGDYVLLVEAEEASPPAAEIPADWDPFAPDRAPDDSIDALFGLDMAASSGAAGSVAAGAASAPVDPLAGWAAGVEPVTVPQARPPPAAIEPARSGGSTAGLFAEIPPPGAVRSWDDPSGESRSTVRLEPRSLPSPADTTFAATTTEPHLDFDFSTPRQPTLAVASPASAAPPAPPAALAPPVPAPARTTQPPASALPPASGAEIAALTAALHEGLGVADLPASARVLTPALMRVIGRLLHEAAQGTVDLLAARAALKREIRAEVTMIVSRENNPLKFSSSAEVALGHLLSPPSRGFMEPQRAMRDAYDDLRAHQFGFLAGMRAALEGVLERFDPAELEGKLTQKSMLASLLPGKRKAQMWDVFNELYGQISSEASDDFHKLFGEEFLRAYNEYIEQLDRERA